MKRNALVVLLPCAAPIASCGLSGSTPVVDQKGVPLASGLLQSEVVKWTEGREPIPGTAWTWRVMRCVQQVENGRVVHKSGFSPVEDADLYELLKKDSVARRS